MVYCTFYHAVILSCSHFIMQSFCHAVILSCGHFVMRLFCHAVILSCGHFVMRLFYFLWVWLPCFFILQFWECLKGSKTVTNMIDFDWYERKWQMKINRTDNKWMKTTEKEEDNWFQQIKWKIMIEIERKWLTMTKMWYIL